MPDYLPPPPELPPGSQVFAYLRDSGGTAQENSVKQQEAAILEFCARYGLALVRVFRDIAKSGGNTAGREAFNEMIAITDDESTIPAGLILWNFARFARNQKESNFFKSLLRMRGVIIHSMTDPIPAGGIAPVVESVLDWSNEEKRRQTKEDVKRGLADMVKAGFTCGGPAPRGYRLVKEVRGKKRDGQSRVASRLEPDPELAPLVTLAFELRAQGKGYGEIIKATGGKLYTDRNSLVTFFRNKSYLGIGKSGGLEIPDHHSPLITWEIWEGVQKAREASPRYGKQGEPLHPRRIAHPYLLSGLARCIHCGAAMVIHNDKDWQSYRCGTRDRTHNAASCPNARRVNRAKADAALLDTVLNRILTPAFVEELAVDIQANLSNFEKIDHEMAEVNNLLTMTGRSIQRLLRLAEDTGNISEISNRLKELKGEEGQLTARLKRLQAERIVDPLEITPEALALVFESWHDAIKDADQSGDILAAKRMISCFVEKIDLGYNVARLKYRYPVSLPAENSVTVQVHQDCRLRIEDCEPGKFLQSAIVSK